MARPKDFMKTVFTDYDISSYASIEKDFTKHGLIVDLARERMENELLKLTNSNLRYEISKLSELGYLEFDKIETENEQEYFPMIFQILKGYKFNIYEDAKVYDGIHGKQVYWNYLVDDIERIEKEKKHNIHATAIPAILPYDERAKAKK